MVRMDFKNDTDLVAKVTGLTLYTQSEKVVHDRIFKKRGSDGKINEPKYIKPNSDYWITFGHGADWPWDIIKKASIKCEAITYDQYENELLGISKSTKDTTTNNWSRTNNKSDSNIWIWLSLGAIFLFVFWLAGSLDKQSIFITKNKDRKNENISKISKNRSVQKNLIQEVWEGNETLSKTFWVYCILIGVIVSLISGVLMGLVGNIFVIIPVIYFVWSSIGLWNSSTKYQNSKLKLQQSYGWAIASKVYVVLNLFTVFGQSILLFAN